MQIERPANRIVLKMSRAIGAWQPGDVAGFQPQRAHELVYNAQAATFFDAKEMDRCAKAVAQKAPSPVDHEEGEKPVPTHGRARLHLGSLSAKLAIELVQGTDASYLEELHELAAKEQRKTVAKAIADHIEQLEDYTEAKKAAEHEATGADLEDELDDF